MSRDTACIVAFENDQTRALVAQGWQLDIIDMDLWRSPVDGYIPRARYVVRGERSNEEDCGTVGTMSNGATPEQAVAAFARHIAELGL